LNVTFFPRFALAGALLALLSALSPAAGAKLDAHTDGPAAASAAVTPAGETPAAPAGSSLDVAAGDVVASALSLIGTPYVYGGKDPDGGFDCSGLVSFVYNMAGYTAALPRSSQELFDLHLNAIGQKDIKAGDLLFFRIGKARKGHVNHVAIYVGNGRFVHSPNSRSVVRLDELGDAYWQKYFVGARRVLTRLDP
jgi:cell wall-associated NlpC family hydrolase